MAGIVTMSTQLFKYLQKIGTDQIKRTPPSPTSQSPPPPSSPYPPQDVNNILASWFVGQFGGKVERSISRQIFIDK